MAFRTSIKKLVENAIVTLNDIAETVTYTSIVQGQYDTFTGQITNTNTEYTFNGVVKYLGGEIAGNETEESLTGDIELLFAGNDLPFAPSTEDTITRGTEVYSINSIKSDAVNASYTLNLVRLG